MDILSKVIAGLIVAAIVTVCAYLRGRRRSIWRSITNFFKHKETEEEAEARRYREMIESDDPDIWKPLK